MWRPRKKVTVSDGESSKDETLKVVLKARKGRPSKKVTTASEDESSQGEPSEQPVKRRRGRPPLKKTGTASEKQKKSSSRKADPSSSQRFVPPDVTLANIHRAAAKAAERGGLSPSQPPAVMLG